MTIGGVVGRAVRVVECDGSPKAVRAMAEAVSAALWGGGPAVLPVPAGPVAVRERLIAAVRPEVGTSEQTALLVATSGSAGEPKVVELPAAVIKASAEATHERLGGPGSWLLALPALHIAGLQVLVRAMLADTTPAMLDLRGGFRPEAFADAAKTLQAGRRYTALVPTQLARLLDAGGSALDGFDAVLVGGAATPDALVERARRAGVRVVTTYGMTETAGGCVYDGWPLRGVRVRLDGEGRIELAGPVLASGYRLRPELTAATFAGGWFRTGDVGRLRPDGRLEVLGRSDDVIVTGGHKVAPTLVERALDTCPTVSEACVVGLPDPDWGELVAAAVTGVRPDVEALRARVRELAGPAAVPKLLVVLPELPRLGIGKIDRDAVRRELLRRRRVDQQH